MSWTANPQQVTRLRIENMLRPEHLERTPRNKWPRVPLPANLKEVWRSRYFLVQIYQDQPGIERMSVCISDVHDEGSDEARRWKDGISWEQLQDLKRQCGRGDRDAVEVYPKDKDVVNVANMRHLFIMSHDLPYAWRKKV